MQIIAENSNDRSAGHRPGQLSSKRIQRAEAVLGAPIHGEVLCSTIQFI